MSLFLKKRNIPVGIFRKNSLYIFLTTIIVCLIGAGLIQIRGQRLKYQANIYSIDCRLKNLERQEFELKAQLAIISSPHKIYQTATKKLGMECIPEKIRYIEVSSPRIMTSLPLSKKCN